MSAIEADGSEQADLVNDAMADFFDQAEAIASDYSDLGKSGTPPGPVR